MKTLNMNLISATLTSTSEILEVFLVGVFFEREFSFLEVSWLILVWEGRFRLEICGCICVTFSIVGNLFFLSQLSYKGNWVSSPDLSSWDQSAWWNNWVREDVSSSLDSGTLHNDSISTNKDIIINDATVDAAVRFNSDILSNVDWGWETVRKCTSCVDSGSISDWREMSNSNWVNLSSDHDVVPDSGVLAHNNFTDYVQSD